MRHLCIASDGRAVQTDQELKFDELRRLHAAGATLYRLHDGSYQQLDLGSREEPKLEWKSVEEIK